MKKYELAILIKPLLPEDVQQKVIPAVNDLVAKLDGTTEIKSEWGKKHLAYAVQGHEEGYYVFFAVEILPSNAKKLEKSLRMINDIMRFLLIQEDQL